VLSSSAPRLRELDALRGLASAIVVLDHFDSLWLPAAKPLWLERLLQSPLRVFVGGHEAVILFFLLSGLVLSLPYLAPDPPGYFSFLVKRVFRIYVPYMAALLLAVMGAAVFHGRIPGMAPWLDRTWTQPVNARLFLQHLAFLGSYDYWQFNGSFWSLIYEMRISLVFPALCLLVAAIRARTAIAIAVVLMVVWARQDWFLTLHYAAIFLVGSLVAKNLDLISAWYLRLDYLGRISFALASLLLFTYGQSTDNLSLGTIRVENFGVTLGALGLVIPSLNSPLLRRLLTVPVLQRLGKVSYSTYLIHLTVLLALLHGLGSSVSVPIFFVLYLAFTGILALLFHRFIEQPAADAGRNLSERIGGWTRVPQTAVLKAP
jgi:peptidoglycan/LPS O-acetylase OafA/YrhL